MPRRVTVEEVETGVMRICTVCLFWLFPTLLFCLRVWQDRGEMDGAAFYVWSSAAYLLAVCATSLFAMLVLRRLVESGPVCFRRKCFLLLVMVWVANPLAVFGLGVVCHLQLLKELCCVPLLFSLTAVTTSRKLFDCTRRYRLQPRGANNPSQAGLCVLTRIVFFVVPLLVLNVQIALYGAAADAPREWVLLEKMNGLGLFLSSLILGKFVAMVLTMGHGLEQPCSLLRGARIGFFCLLLSADWVCLSALLKQEQDKNHPDGDDAAVFDRLRAALVVLSYLMGCDLLLLSVTGPGRKFPQLLAAAIGMRGRGRGWNPDMNAPESRPDPNTQFLLSPEPFSRELHSLDARRAKKLRLDLAKKEDKGEDHVDHVGGQRDDHVGGGEDGGNGGEVGGAGDHDDEVVVVATEQGEGMGLGPAGANGNDVNQDFETESTASTSASTFGGGASARGGWAGGGRGDDEHSTVDDFVGDPARRTLPWSPSSSSSSHVIRVEDAGSSTPSSSTFFSYLADSFERAFQFSNLTDDDNQMTRGRTNNAQNSRARAPLLDQSGDAPSHGGRAAPELSQLGRQDTSRGGTRILRGANDESASSSSSAAGATTTSRGLRHSAGEVARLASSIAQHASTTTSSSTSSSPAARAGSGSPTSFPDREKPKSSTASMKKPLLKRSPSSSNRSVSSSSDGSGLSCTICLTEFEDGELVRTMPECEHLFHASCLERWARSQGASCLCPMCRRPAYTDSGKNEDCLAYLNAQEVSREAVSLEENQGLIARARPLAASLNVDLLIAALAIRILENDLQAAAHVLLEHKSLLERLQRESNRKIRPRTRTVVASWADGIIEKDGCLDASVRKGLMLQLQALPAVSGGGQEEEPVSGEGLLSETTWAELTEPQRTRVYSLMLADVIDRLNNESA